MGAGGVDQCESRIGRWSVAYLDVIPPELQQGGETSLDLAEELVEESQLSDSVLVQQGAQTWRWESQTVLI